MTEPRSTIGATLREEVQRDLERLARRRRVCALALLGLLVLVLAGAQMMGGAPLHWTRWAPAVAFAAGGAALLALALGLVLPDRARLSLACLALVGGGLVLLAVAARPGADSGGGHFVHLGTLCLLHGSATASMMTLAVLVAGYGLLRRFAPTGALVGGGAGLVALAALQLACPIGGIGHLMLWHGLVLVGFGLLVACGWPAIARLRD